MTKTERKADLENYPHGTATHGNGSSAPEGFEQATGTYHGPPNRPQEGANDNQDPAQESDMDLELIDLTEDQDGLNKLSGRGSVTQPTEQGPTGATDARAAALVKLIQVQQEGRVLNITDALTGQELAGLEHLKELLKDLPNPKGNDRDDKDPSANRHSECEELTTSSGEDSGDETSRASESESLKMDPEEPRKPTPPRLY